MRSHQIMPGPLPHTCLQSVSGPMARNVPDLALLLDAMTTSGPDPVPDLALLLDAMTTAGPDPAGPGPQGLPGPDSTGPGPQGPPRASYFDAVMQEAPPRLTRVAFSPDLGGVSPVDPEVASSCQAAAAWLESLGAEVVGGACPDFVGCQAASVFHTLRGLAFRCVLPVGGRRACPIVMRVPASCSACGQLRLHPTVVPTPCNREHRALAMEPLRGSVKPELVWQVEQGLALTSSQVGREQRWPAAQWPPG